MSKLKKRQGDQRLADAINNFDKDIDVTKIKEVETTIGSINIIPQDVIINNEPIGLGEVENSTDELATKYFADVNVDELYAAPIDWNLWSPHSTEKKLELMESIKEIGLQQNIVVWKVPDGLQHLIGNKNGYMILAGHNRLEAIRTLFFIFNDTQFFKIHALVYVADVINERIARRIIDDTNLVMRDRTPREISDAYLRRVNELKESEELRDASERQLHLFVANEKGVSRSTVYKHLKLQNCIDPIFDQVNNEISFTVGIKLSSLEKDKQEYIYNEYYLNESNRHLYNNNNLAKIKPLMTIATIDRALRGKDDKILVSYEVESHLKEDLDKLVRKFISSNK
ncbi:MAG: ParB N-terminal domain-containing protein [Clostridia bacterium]|nr:ParB N-terminal domain-containing protein [Clostridia bacterium]